MVTTQNLGPIARRSIPDAIKHVFEKADGTPRDLTGYTVVAYVQRPGDVGPVQKAAEVVDATTGSVRYVFAEGDLAMEDTGGSTKVKTIVQFVVENATTGRRHISDPAAISVASTPASSEYDV